MKYKILNWLYIKVDSFRIWLYYKQFEARPTTIEEFKQQKKLVKSIRRRRVFAVVSQCFTPVPLNETPNKTVNQL